MKVDSNLTYLMLFIFEGENVWINNTKITATKWLLRRFCRIITLKSSIITSAQQYNQLLLSSKNKLKALYLFIHRCCSRFTHP